MLHTELPRALPQGSMAEHQSRLSRPGSWGLCVRALLGPAAQWHSSNSLRGQDVCRQHPLPQNQRHKGPKSLISTLHNTRVSGAPTSHFLRISGRKSIQLFKIPKASEIPWIFLMMTWVVRGIASKLFQANRVCFWKPFSGENPHTDFHHPFKHGTLGHTCWNHSFPRSWITDGSFLVLFLGLRLV